MDTVQEKCDRKIEMLTKRDFERKLDLQKEQEIRKLTSADNEKIDYFESVFNEKRRFIANAIDEARNLDIDKLGVHFNNISRDILILQKYLATSNIFLRGYDIKIYQQVLQNLTNQARDLEDELLPKKKFGFKKKTSQKIDVGNGINCFINEDLNGFSERTDTNLMLSNSEIFKKDILLSKLNNCKIKLFGSPSTLHMNFLKDCYVFCGPVSTSIFAESCENSAIMEDSSNIFIAPYNLEYDNIEEDFKKSGLAGCSNNWTSIDDFNWLKLDQKSPNWNIIDETKRIEKWSNFF
ncbi:tubulin folding cofactor c [Holotrichia oblita]|uniref:Tubulin folding cofactor c n=1 Tax=Holotrichia oblita TaxID=644536 RepID=A0ACB9TAN2_HOLOL|nr:tubulin folding cofactor c [Holotrichia oblita]